MRFNIAGLLPPVGIEAAVTDDIAAWIKRNQAAAELIGRSRGRSSNCRSRRPN